MRKIPHFTDVIGCLHGSFMVGDIAMGKGFSQFVVGFFNFFCFTEDAEKGKLLPAPFTECSVGRTGK